MYETTQGELMALYDVKWQNDLSIYMDSFSSFILEGAVHDLHPVRRGDGYVYESLEMTLARLYSDRYCVVFYDNNKKAGAVVEAAGQEDEDEGGEPAQGNGNGTRNEFNSFTFFENEVPDASGRMVPNPNIELFRKYYRGDYANEVRDTASSNQQGSFALDVRRIRDAMKDYGDNVTRTEVRDQSTGRVTVQYQSERPEYQNTKPFLFILPGVSRYMTRPGDPDASENVPLTILYGATQIAETPCKLMLFVDKINDLPTWFEAEDSNPSIKKLYLAPLDASFRKSFFENEMVNVFDPIPSGQEDKLLDRFAAYTENYSLRRLQQLRNFVITSEDHLDRNLRNIDKAVLKFESGQSKDPWRSFDMYEKVDRLEATLNKAIQGQEHVTAAIQRSIKAAVTGTSTISKNDRRPRAIFFLAGPTGTGKTEVTKRLTETIFGNPDSMVVFDMSEFKEEHTASRLFGAPPGYVGYEAGGELTKAVKNNPFTVVLFDEIEKAHSSIWDKFLQILGEGRLTDGKGETVYFTKSIIVFTSNLGVPSEIKNITTAQRNELRAAALAKEAEILAKIQSATNDAARETQLAELGSLEEKRASNEGLNVSFAEHAYFRDYYKHFGFESALAMFNDFAEKTVRQRIIDYFTSTIGRPEILGRIGEHNILTYHFISPSIATKIADSALNKAKEYYSQDHDFHIDLDITDKAAVDFIHRSVQEPQVLDLGGRGIVTRVTELLSAAIQEFVYEYGRTHGRKGEDLVFENVHAALHYDPNYGLYVE